MKVGIITFHRALNYGAVLQAYALQQYLNGMGVENDIIDYRCQYIEEFYKPIKANPFQKPKTYIREVLFSPYNRGKREKFELFISKYLKTSKTIHSHDELKALNREYDFFIAGSDQIWNLKWSGFDKAYFLDFADDRKKASYAASFGFDAVPENEKKAYQDLLTPFRYLSVRENTGRQIIRDLVDCDATVSLDPTCLIEKEKWDDIAVKPNETGYVLMYTLDKSEKLISFARKKAKELNTKIIYISDALKKTEDFEYRGFLSPAEFVGLFRNSGYVVTNSFHGLMFSVIFEKAFCLEYQLSKGAPNSRLKDFVQDFRLGGCVLQNNMVTETIDYTYVKSRMSAKRVETEEYFKSILASTNNIVLPTVKEKCCGCRACEQVCPKSAIRMEADIEGFLYPEIDSDKCVKCGQCLLVCKFKDSQLPETPQQPLRTVIAYHNDEAKRLRSRSGGVFAAVTDKLLKQGTIVYGVKLDSHFQAVHSRATDATERDKFCGSKYVQSDTGHMYNQVMKDLRNGYKVLFSGTACQISGLKQFLNVKHCSLENLLTVDIVCHGVMSPLLWKENLKEIQDKSSGAIIDVDFRNKIFGWDSHIETYQTEDECIRSERYTSVFYSHRALRPSCYNCPFATTERCSDITLADAWGIKRVAPEWNSSKGVSFVLINTDIGMTLIADVQKELTLADVDLQSMMQPNLLNPTPMPSDRERFWTEYRMNGFSSAAEQCEKEQMHIKSNNARKAKIVKLLRKMHLK